MKIPNNNYYAKIRKAIKQIVNYMEYDEKWDWEASNKPKNHIWVSIKMLKDSL